MGTGNSEKQGNSCYGGDNPMEGCAPSQPSFDPGHDRACPSINATT